MSSREHPSNLQADGNPVNFTAYTEFKALLQDLQADPEKELPSYQTMFIGLVSGAMGPLSNAPIDTISTRPTLPPFTTMASTDSEL